mgnify:CR=1 FL=1
MNMITEKCTGCRACEQLCPKKCISLQADDEGFLQTVIEETECVHCGLCERICPQNHLPEKSAPLRVVAARYKDDEVLKRSASGGVFAGVARRVIRREVWFSVLPTMKTGGPDTRLATHWRN